MKITVLYAKPKMRFPVFSWLIRLAEGTHGSHVAILICFESDTSVVFESVSPKSRIISDKRWNDHYETLKEWDFAITEEQIKPSLLWVADNTDKDYSRFQCLLIGIAELCGGWVKTLVRKQNPNGSEYLICVEAASRFATQFLGLKFSSPPDVLGLKEFIDTLDQYKEK